MNYVKKNLEKIEMSSKIGLGDLIPFYDYVFPSDTQYSPALREPIKAEEFFAENEQEFQDFRDLEPANWTSDSMRSPIQQNVVELKILPILMCQMRQSLVFYSAMLGLTIYILMSCYK